MRTIIFTVVTASFIPLVWQARAGIGFFAFGTISGWSWVTKPIPNSEKIFRLMPFGLPRTLLMLLIGKWVGSNLVNWNPDPASRVHNATIYLALPGLAFTILGMLGRDGTRMELKWWHRFVGVGVLVVFLHFKLGWFW